MLEALFRNDAWGFMLQPVSQENEQAVCQSMVDGCRCHTTVTRVCISALRIQAALAWAAQRSSLLKFYDSSETGKHWKRIPPPSTRIWPCWVTRLLRLGAALPARRSRCVSLLSWMHTKRIPSRHEVPLMQAAAVCHSGCKSGASLARCTAAAARLPALCLHRCASGRRRGWTQRCGGSRTARSASTNWSTTRCAAASSCTACTNTLPCMLPMQCPWRSLSPCFARHCWTSGG